MALIGALLLALPGPALAQLHMCNETEVSRSFAIGYKDGADWVSEGWWSIESGACKTVRGAPLHHAYFYYRATTGGAFTGQGYRFCTDTAAFTIVGDEDCAERGYARDDFSQIEIGKATEFTFTLTAASSSQTAAAPRDVQQPAQVPAVAEEPWGMTVYEPGELPATVVRFGDDLGCDMVEAMGAWGGHGMGLADGSTLYLVPCYNADINVEHFVAMRPAGASDFRLYDFESPPGDNMANHRLLSSVYFDPDTMSLVGHTAYGPNNDCGLHERHVYVADGDYFELVEQREKLDCDGVYDLPEHYPLRWTIEEMGG